MRTLRVSPAPASVLLLTFALSCSTPDRSTTGPVLGGAASLAKAPSSPTVSATSPSEAPRDTTIDVHVIGSGFDNGSRADFLLAGVADPKVVTNRTTYINSGDLVANITIARDAVIDVRDVLVTTSGGKKGIGTAKFAVVLYEVLLAMKGGSSVATHGVSGNGLIAGSISSSCSSGFAATIWSATAELITLPFLSGTCGGTAWSVNRSGVAVGSAWADIIFDVRWTPGPGGYTVDRLPLLPDGTRAGPGAVNDAGAITSANYAAVWTDATGWQVLQWLPNATICRSRNINDAGVIIGQCYVGGVPVGVVWLNASASPLILPLPTGSNSPYPGGINAAGTIVGAVTVAPTTRNGSSVLRAVRWTPISGGYVATLLPDLGAGGSANDVNTEGMIAGINYSPSGNGYARPVYWDAAGTLHVLESSDRVGEALGISDVADGLLIAGYIRSGGGGGAKIAVRWRP